MSTMSPLQVSDEQGKSLQALLHAVDCETAPALAQDMAVLKEQAARSLRKKRPYISFILGNDEMALPTDSIQEIGELPQVTPLPNIAPWIAGIVQIRGEILSVVDFIALFKIKCDRGRSFKRSYVLFKQQDFKFCLVVDRITGVVNIDEQRDHLGAYVCSEGDPLAALSPFFKGVLVVGSRTVHLLESDKLGNAPQLRKWR